MAKKWTDEEIQFLKFAYPNKDITASDIAKELGRTKNQVFKKASELKIRKNEERLPVGHRRCGRCKTILVLECFSPNNNWCKQCHNEYKKTSKHAEVKKDISLQVAMKKCPKCKEVKEVSEFNKNKFKKDGLNAYCRLCQNKANKESRYKKIKERGW